MKHTTDFNADPVIVVRGLTKRYRGAAEAAVDDIAFTVGRGEFFALLGPNGAGKTTTISILTTTLGRTSGFVAVAGYDPEHQARQVRENIGILFQKPALDRALSAEENIRFHACLYGMYPYRPFFRTMPSAYKDRVMELAEIVGIRDSLFEPVRKLSGGMQRKLEIVRSLIHLPAVLFLDEPTQGLDAVSRRSLWRYIDRVRREKGTTVFLTTHYIDEAENVDRICVVNRGKIAVSGTPGEMKERLLRKELILDADDRAHLLRELTDMGLRPKNAGAGDPLRVDWSGSTAQNVITRLNTRLTVLKIHEPSLEDAYVELLRRSGGEAA